MIDADSLHYHFCRYVDLVGGDLFRVGELSNDEKGLFLGGSWGFIAELIEVYKGLGYWEDKGGWSLVVGYVSTMGVSGVRSPIWGISAMRALWSLNSVGIAVVVVSGCCCASVGMRIN